MMKRVLLLLALLVPAALSAQDETSAGFGLDPSDVSAIRTMRARMEKIRRHRPTVALVMSGGGAKGAATVGALKYLEQYKLPVDLVVGTSIGGLIGGVYAMGYSPDFLDSLMRNMDWGLTLSDKVEWKYMPYDRRRYREKFLLNIPFYYSLDDYKEQRAEEVQFATRSEARLHISADENEPNLFAKSLTTSLPSGLVFGQNVEYLLSSLMLRYSDSLDFFSLPIPFACIATDVVSGKAKVWHSGSLHTAMRSTMSIPGLFAPVRTNGMVLIDGGMRNNFPVDIARQLGADIVIGIDLSTSKSDYTEIHNIGDILWRGIDMFAEDSFERNIKNVDVRINPDMTGYGMMSFDAESVDTMLVRGYKGAEAKAEELNAVRRWLGKDTLKRASPPAIDLKQTRVRIDSVEVSGISGKDADYLRKKLKVHAGDRVTRAEVEDAVNSIYGKGTFEYVKYELLGSDEPFRLKISCKRGPIHRLGLGFRIDTEELVSLLLNIGLNTTAMRGSSLDVTARVGTNPFLDMHYMFETPALPTINVRADLRWTDHNNFLMGENRFNIAYLSSSQEVYFSNMQWSKLDVKLGFKNSFFNIAHMLASDVIGDYARSLNKMDYPGLFAEATTYTLDDGYFPRHGVSATLRYDIISRICDGPDYPGFFGILSGSGRMPVPLGSHFALIPQGGFRFVVGEDIPVPFANLIGGDMVGRYMDHQLPFIGLNNATFRRNNLVVLRTDLRFQFLKHNYITLMGNVSRDFSSFRNFEDGEDLWGVGLGYAYNTVVGPLKAIVHWSSKSRRVGAYLSVGFDF